MMSSLIVYIYIVQVKNYFLNPILNLYCIKSDFKYIIFQKFIIMPFFIRLFSKHRTMLSREILLGAIAGNEKFKKIRIEKESTNTHDQFLVKKDDLELLIILELIPFNRGYDKKRIHKIIDSVSDKKPSSSVKWVKNFLKKTKIYYEFIPLADLEEDDDWELFSLLYQEAWAGLRGIFQIKDEGFTNESGDLIVWDFPYSAAGKRVAAIRSFTGRWKTFEMDLESMVQRKAFFSGRLPKNIKTIFRG